MLYASVQSMVFEQNLMVNPYSKTCTPRAATVTTTIQPVGKSIMTSFPGTSEISGPAAVGPMIARHKSNQMDINLVQ